jgi:hypothetical protein
MGRGEAGGVGKFFDGVLDLEGGVTEFRCWCGAGVFEPKKKQSAANFRAREAGRTLRGSGWSGPAALHDLVWRDHRLAGPIRDIRQGRGKSWLTGKWQLGKVGEEKANMLRSRSSPLCRSIAYGCRVFTC